MRSVIVIVRVATVVMTIESAMAIEIAVYAIIEIVPTIVSISVRDKHNNTSHSNRNRPIVRVMIIEMLLEVVTVLVLARATRIRKVNGSRRNVFVTISVIVTVIVRVRDNFIAIVIEMVSASAMVSGVVKAGVTTFAILNTITLDIVIADIMVIRRVFVTGPVTVAITAIVRVLENTQ